MDGIRNAHTPAFDPGLPVGPRVDSRSSELAGASLTRDMRLRPAEAPFGAPAVAAAERRPDHRGGSDGPGQEHGSSRPRATDPTGHLGTRIDVLA